MLTYITRRILLSALVLIGVTVIAFILTRIVPANPGLLWTGPHATAEQVAEARKELGLDKPLYAQYFQYIVGTFSGDWGTSFRTHAGVLEDIGSRLPASLELIFGGMFIAVLLGVPLGAISAVKNGTIIDHLARVFSIAGVALPTFWLGMILQLVFFKQLGWFPLAGRVDSILKLTNPISQFTGFYLIDSLIAGNLKMFTNSLWHLFLPALTLAAYPLGLSARMTRATLLEVLNEDYIRTARSTGVREFKILGKYALKNSFGPVLTVLSLAFAYSLVSTFLIEIVFTWPGIGSYASKAIMTVDYPAIMGVVILVAFAYIFLNLAVDVTLAVMDPRIRVG